MQTELERGQHKLSMSFLWNCIFQSNTMCFSATKTWN